MIAVLRLPAPRSTRFVPAAACARFAHPILVAAVPFVQTLCNETVPAKDALATTTGRRGRSGALVVTGIVVQGWVVGGVDAGVS